MNKTERLELTLKGIKVLRAKYDHHVKAWKIYSHTKNGGWECFSQMKFKTSFLCNEFIDEMCKDSEIYRKDD